MSSFRVVLLIVILMICSQTVFSQLVAGLSGSGNSANDPVKITSMNDLRLFSNFVAAGGITQGKYFRLENDLTGEDDVNIANALGRGLPLASMGSLKSNLLPIGGITNGLNPDIKIAFKGTFDGNGKKITNLHIRLEYYSFGSGILAASASYSGLFGYTDGAIIKNLALEYPVISGFQYVGGVVGYAKNTTITNCYVTTKQIIISNVFSFSAGSNNAYMGGLIGYAEGGKIDNSSVYIADKIENYGDCTYIGGFIGKADSVSVSNSYSRINGYNKLGNNTYKKVFVGEVVNNTIIKNSFYVANTSFNDDLKIRGLLQIEEADLKKGCMVVMLNAGQNASNANAWQWKKDSSPRQTVFNDQDYSSAPKCWGSETNPSIDGSTDAKAYQISSRFDLRCLSAFVMSDKDNTLTVSNKNTYKKHFKLTSNITFGSYDDIYEGITSNGNTGWSEMSNFIPIGGWSNEFTNNTNKFFAGNFNGNKQKIKNLKIQRPIYNANNTFVGLFGIARGQVGDTVNIYDLYVENYILKGFQGLGLVGRNDQYVTMQRCSAQGEIEGFGYIGGLVGHNAAATSISINIRECFSDVNVKANGGQFNGGLIGYSNFTQVNNCYALGSLESNATMTQGYHGGLIGYAGTSGNGLVRNSFVVARNFSVNGTASYFGLLSGIGGTYTNSYAMEINPDIKAVNNNNAVGQYMTMTDRDMRTRFMAAILNEGNDDPQWIWEEEYPKLKWQCISCKVEDAFQKTADNFYQINTPEDLRGLSLYVALGKTTKGKSFRLMNDIDMSSDYFPYNENGYWAEESNFIPIGGWDYNARANVSRAFSGTFDGNGKKISNLKVKKYYYNATNNNFVGLFGYTNGSIDDTVRIYNVGLENVDISGYQYVGGLIGYINQITEIKESYVKGNVIGYDNTGGFIGRLNTTSKISNSYSHANISAYGANNGGFAGSISNAITAYCYAAPSSVVTDPANTPNGLFTGAISGTVRNCLYMNGISSSLEGAVGNVANAGILPLSDTDMRTRFGAGLLNDLNPKQVWKNKLGEYPILAWEDENGVIAQCFEKQGDNYLIKDIEDLRNLSSYVALSKETRGKTFQLQNDIVFTQEDDIYRGKSWQEASNFIPIGGWSYQAGQIDANKYFAGIFDGNNKKIKNLKIKRQNVNGNNYVGLFGNVHGLAIGDSAYIYNLGIENSQLSGNQMIGGLIGRLGNRVIVSNTYSKDGQIEGYGYLGGLIGNVESYNIVENSYSLMNISNTGGPYTGGFIAYSVNSAIRNNYSVALSFNIIENASSSYASFIGYNNIASSNCYNEILENIPLATGNLTGVYLLDKDDMSTSCLGGMLNDNQDTSIWMYKDGKTSLKWENIEGSVEANCFKQGNGTKEKPYEIETLEHLRNLSLISQIGKSTRGKNYKLVEDIYFTEQDNIYSLNPEDNTQKSNFISIGGWNYKGLNSNTSKAFAGTFDGGYHTINNLKIIRGSADEAKNRYVGLFGYLTGIVGDTATVINIGVKDCYVKGYNQVSAIVGSSSAITKIKNSYSTGQIISQSGYVGGIVGYAQNSNLIESSYSTVSILSYGSYNGGIVGYCNNSFVNNSYAIPTLTCNNGSYHGGLIGILYNNSYVSNSYSSIKEGSVANNSARGAFIGNYLNPLGTLTNCYNSSDLWPSIANTNVYAGITPIPKISMQEECFPSLLGNKGIWQRVKEIEGKIINDSLPVLTWQNEGVDPKTDIKIIYMTDGGVLDGFTQLEANQKYEQYIGCYKRFSEPIAVKQGLVFNGWYKDVKKQQRFQFDKDFLDRDTILYANYISVCGGSGSQENPYLICSIDDLKLLAKEVNSGNTFRTFFFKLTTDLDFRTAPMSYDGGKSNFIPIGGWKEDGSVSDDNNYFAGNFDGAGHTIQGLKIIKSRTASSNNFNVGLFGVIGGMALSKDTVKITNIGVVNPVIIGYQRVGGLVGWNKSVASISNSYVISSSSGIDSIAANNYVGGLIGYNNSSIIENCYTRTRTYVASNCHGGLIGYNLNTKIFNSYSAPISLSGATSSKGLFVGNHSGSSYSKCFHSDELSWGSVNNTTYQGIISTKLESMRSDCFPAILGPKEIWQRAKSGVNNALPVLTWEKKGNNPANSIIVDFNTMGADQMPPRALECDPILEEPVPTYLSASGEGYIFRGWYKEEELVNRWIFGKDLFDRDITLYARWDRVCGGFGTKESPFLICDVPTLRLISNDVMEGRTFNGVYFKLSSDIIFIGSDNIYDLDTDGIKESNFIPIGGWSSPSTNDANKYFAGSFDGGGYKISGMRILRKLGNGDYIGLFGRTRGDEIEQDSVSIKNVGMLDVKLSGRNSIGGLIGSAWWLTNVDNCYVTGEINGTSYIGGLIGYSENKNNVNNSYSTASIKATATNPFAGGLIGRSNNLSSVQRCFAAPKSFEWSGDSYRSLLIGYVDNGTILNNYYSLNSAPNTDILAGGSVYATGLSDDEMKTDCFAYILNSSQDNVWKYQAGNYPLLYWEIASTAKAPTCWNGKGTEQEPYMIANVNQLRGLSLYVAADTSNTTTLISEKNTFGKYFRLNNDIKFESSDNIYKHSAYWNAPSNFIPIGGWASQGVNSTSKVFAGKFDGNGKVISNLSIQRPITSSNSYVGLFGYVSGDISKFDTVVINNLGIENAVFQGYSLVGAIVGRNNDLVQVNNSYSKYVTINGYYYLGGLIGDNSSRSIVNNCYSIASLKATREDNSIDVLVGGLVGRNVTGSVIKNSYAAPLAIEIPSSTTSYVRAGLMIGYNNTNNTVFNSYSSNTVNNYSNCGDGYSGITLSNYEMKTSCFAYILNAQQENTWRYVPNEYPSLTWENKLNNQLPIFNCWNGDGTQEKPFEITSVYDLRLLSAYVAGDTSTTAEVSDKNTYKKNFILKSDIIFEEKDDIYSKKTVYFDDNSNFLPIGGILGEYGSSTAKFFAGNFDGNNKRIKNIKSKRRRDLGGNDYSALFGFICGDISKGADTIKIRNLGIDNCNITGCNFTGALVGMTSNSVNSVVKIENCYANGRVSGYRYIGGIAGNGNNTIYNNCYTTASVSGIYATDIRMGGFIGQTHTSQILNSYAAASEIRGGSTYVGSFIGYIGTGTNDNSYFLEVDGIPGVWQGTKVGTFSKTQEEFKTSCFPALIGDHNTWHYANQGVNNGYPVLTWQNEGTAPKADIVVSFNTMGGNEIPKQNVLCDYAINPIPLATHPNGYIFEGWYKEETCENKFDFNKELITVSTTLYAKWDNKNNRFCEGDGTEANPFIICNSSQLKFLSDQVSAGFNYSGVYFKLKYDIDMSSETNFVPIGGWSGQFTNDTLRYFSGNFDGDSKIITNLTVPKSVTNVKNSNYVGLFGYVKAINNNPVIIKNVSLERCVFSGYQYVGGLIGRSDNEVFIKECYVKNNTNVSAQFYIGGLIGQANKTNIDNSYTITNTSATNANSYMGGFIGHSVEAEVSNSYSVIRSSFSGGNLYRGLFIGYDNGSTFNNCYNSITYYDNNNDINIGSVNNDYYEGVVATNKQGITIDCFIAAKLGTDKWRKDNYPVNNYHPVLRRENTGAEPGTGPYTLRLCLNNADKDTSKVLFNCYEVPDIAIPESVDRKIFNGWYKDAICSNRFDFDVDLLDRDTMLYAKYVSFCDGRGTKEDPYTICTVEDLRTLSQEVMSGTTFRGNYFKLTEDIIFADTDLIYDLDNDGVKESNFIPIGGWSTPMINNTARYFGGVFDGNGKVIKGLKILKPYTNPNNTNPNDVNHINYVGLFGIVRGFAQNRDTAKVYNLGVENYNIKGYNHGGGLIANCEYAQVDNCYAEGENRTLAYNGGLIGSNYAPVSISNSYAKASIYGITTSTSQGYIGGFIGYNNNTNNIVRNSYSTTPYIEGSGNSYGLFVGNDISVMNSYYTAKDNDLKPGTHRAIALSEEDMRTEGFAAILNIGQESSWNYIEGQTPKQKVFEKGKNPSSVWKGQGTSADPYKIETKTDLRLLSAYVAADTNLTAEAYQKNTYRKYYELTNDIKFEDKDNIYREYNPYWLETSNFLPIGGWAGEGLVATKLFAGFFDGKGYKIEGLKTIKKIENSNSYYIGLFGRATEAIISNIGLENCMFSGYNQVGAICGRADSAVLLENVYSSGKLTAFQYVGGLGGYFVKNTEIRTSFSKADIEVAGSSYNGGIVGRCDYSDINSCYFIGSFKAKAATYHGGIAGYYHGGTKISNSYSAPSSFVIDGDATNVGIIAGGGTTVENSYAKLLDNPEYNIAPGGTLNVPDVDMKTKGFAYLLNYLQGNKNWKYVQGEYPKLKWEKVSLSEVPISLWDGQGISENPYQIKNTSDLRMLSIFVMRDTITVTTSLRNTSGVNFILQENITFEENELCYKPNSAKSNGWTEMSNFIPIGGYVGENNANDLRRFAGVFNGNAKRVSGLRIFKPTIYNGLFGRAEGNIGDSVRIFNLGIEDCDLRGSSHTGGIVGYARMLVLENSYSKGRVSTTGNNYLGGLIGYIDRGITNNCYSRTAINFNLNSSTSFSGYYFGGLIGHNVNSKLYNSYASPIEYNGFSTHTNGYGLLTGYSNLAVINCYYSDSISDKPYKTNGSYRIYEQDMKSPCFSTILLNGKQYQNAWKYVEGEYPVLAWEGKGVESKCWNGDGSVNNPYLIDDIRGLRGLSYFVMSDDDNSTNVSTKNTYRKNFKLNSNILFTESDAIYKDSIWIGASNHIPIGGWSLDNKGNKNKFFAGIFNGNDKTIIGLKILKDNNSNYVGLFGNIKGQTKDTAMIYNLGVEAVNISGGQYVGAVIASSEAVSTVRKVYSTGEIKAKSYIGGLIGNTTATTLVEDCYSIASIEAESNNAGGLVGRSKNSEIRNSYAVPQNFIATASNNGTFLGVYDLGIINNCYTAKTIEGIAPIGNTTLSGMFSRSLKEMQSGCFPNNLGIASIWQKANEEINDDLPVLKWQGKGVDAYANIIVRFDVQGKGVNPRDMYVSCDFILKERPSPTYPKYIFMGWYKESGCINRWDFSNEQFLDEQTTLYAKWEETKGDGTQINPYEIYNVSDLRKLSEGVMNQVTYRGAFFKLMNDIQFVESDDIYNENIGWTGKSNFIPIGGWKSDSENDTNNYFAGNVDGQGFNIIGLKMFKDNTIMDNNNYLGLFGLVSGLNGQSKANIKNLGVYNSSLKGFEYVGGLIGRGKKFVKIDKSFTNVDIVGDSYIGGLAGSMEDSSIVDNSYSRSSLTTINKNPSIGGLVGYNKLSSILNSYSSPIAFNTVSNTLRGLFVGVNTSGIIMNCYNSNTEIPNVGSVNNRTDAGVYVQSKNGMITNCFVTQLGDNSIWHFDNNKTNDSYPVLAINKKGNIPLTEINVTFVKDEDEKDVKTYNCYPILEEEELKAGHTTQIFIGWYKEKELLNRWDFNKDRIDRDTTLYAKYITFCEDGKGTESEPFEICDAQRLKLLSELVMEGNKFSNTYFKLTSDIDFSSVDKEYDDNKSNFIPIGGWSKIGNDYVNDTNKYFSGIFDGNNFTINNLCIEKSTTVRTNNNYVGLFGLINSIQNIPAQVKNLQIKQTNEGNLISGYRYVGGIVGESRNKVIITNSYTDVNAKADSYIGGIVGYHRGESKIDYCYSESELEALSLTVNNAYVGGLVGYNILSSISNSYAAPKAIKYHSSSKSGYGIFVGRYESGIMLNNYNISDVNINGVGYYSPMISITGVMDINEEDMKSKCFVVAFNGNDKKWQYFDNNYPVLSQFNISGAYNVEKCWDNGEGTFDSPYQINNIADLRTLSFFVSHDANNDTIVENKNTYGKYFILNNNIEFTLRDDNYIADNKYWSDNSNFLPIGGWNNEKENNSNKFFAGFFNGNKKTIKGLKILRVADEYIVDEVNKNNDYVGLFGNVKGNVDSRCISNLRVEDATISGFRNVGGLVGYNTNAKISATYFSGSVGGYINIGGLIGQNMYAEVENSYSRAVIKSGFNSSGGFIGKSHYSKISNSYSAPLAMNGSKAYCGTFVGDIDGFITNCYASVLDGINIIGIGFTDGVMVADDNALKSGYLATMLNACNNPSIWDWNKDAIYNDGYPTLSWEGKVNNPEILPCWNVENEINNGSSTKPAKFRYVADILFLKKDVEFGSHYKNFNIQLHSDINMMGNKDSNTYISSIGLSQGAYFSGTIDGNHKSLANLRLDNNTQDDLALFAKTDGATIKNLILSNVLINGNNNVAGIIANAKNTTMENVFVTGEITAKADNAGSLIANADNNSVIITSHANVIITGNSNIGGLVGNLSGKISNSYSNSTIAGKMNVGGIVGLTNSSTNISNVLSLNKIYRIQGTETSFGKIAGSSEGNFTNNYSRDSVMINIYDALGYSGESKSNIELRSDMFISHLNNSGVYWKTDYSVAINNGYPILTYQSAPAVVAKSGKYYDKTTWLGDNIPISSQIIVIPASKQLSVEDNSIVSSLIILEKGGELINKGSLSYYGEYDIEMELGKWNYVGFATNKRNLIDLYNYSDNRVLNVFAKRFDYVKNRWQENFVKLNDVVNNGEGILVMPNYSLDSDSLHKPIYKFKGRLNNCGDFSYAYVNANEPKWVSLANSYTASLKTQDLISQNNLQGQLVYVFDAKEEKWINPTSISPSQGFFVAANNASGTINFSNSMLSIISAKKNIDASNQIFRVVSKANNHKREALADYNLHADNSFDIYDAYKLFGTNPNAVEPYFCIENNKAQFLKDAFNTIPYTANLNLRSENKADVTLLFENIPNGLRAFLIDELSGIKQDLSIKNEYSLKINKGDNANRLKVVFTDINDDISSLYKDEIVVKIYNSILDIEGKELVRFEIQNVMGQRVDAAEIMRDKYKTGINLPTGAYMVTVYSKTNKKTVKVFVR